MSVSFRKCQGTNIPRTSTFPTQTQKNQALKPLNGGRYVRHSGSALVPIPHKRLSLPFQNAQNLALKPLNGGMLGCKKGCGTLQL